MSKYRARLLFPFRSICMGLPGARRRQSSLVKPEGPASWPRPQYQPLPDPEMISIDAGTPNRQRRWLKFVAVAVVASFAVAFLWHKSPTQQSVLWLRGAQDDRLGVGRPAGDTVPCVGPSGLNYQEDATFSLDEATLPERKSASPIGNGRAPMALKDCAHPASETITDSEQQIQSHGLAAMEI